MAHAYLTSSWDTILRSAVRTYLDSVSMTFYPFDTVCFLNFSSIFIEKVEVAIVRFHFRGTNDTSAYLATTLRTSKNRSTCRTHFPFTLHFSPAWSSLSATSWGTPTATSALFVRKLRIGKSPARGPCSKGEFWHYLIKCRSTYRWLHRKL